ncbi:MAG: DUF3137 domain-containing protein [Alphaproteobacteria bacterium]|nr:DUF3137 domain-containing protein [Alphaproteobacteria bacterium]
MSDPQIQAILDDSSEEGLREIIRPDPQRFTAEIDALLKRAEAIRLSHMKRQRSRSNIVLTLSLLFLTVGASGFGWFLLVEGDILRAIGSIALAIIVPAALNILSTRGFAEYRRAYKEEFLPDLAKALGGFHFSPTRGINPKIISKAGVLPNYKTYHAEDCFTGNYKGVKVIFSEASLHGDKKNAPPLFDGIFVLLEIPENLIEGHTVMTADTVMCNKWRSTRWKQLQHVEIPVQNPEWARFQILSNKPESAKQMISAQLIKELCEAADIFDRAPITAVFFQKKYIFLTIPYDEDMFEPSNMHMPVATHSHIMRCRREVEQIFQIVDIFDLYATQNRAETSVDTPVRELVKPPAHNEIAHKPAQNTEDTAQRATSSAPPADLPPTDKP